MLVDNKISRFLTGPYILIGISILISGMFSLFYQRWDVAGIHLFISWYLFATYSGVDIDTETKTFRSYHKHFGLFKRGKWKPLSLYLGFTLVPMEVVYRMYSRSNRSNASSKKEFRIYFVDKNKKPAIPVKCCRSLEQAQNSLDEFAIWTRMPVFSVKR